MHFVDGDGRAMRLLLRTVRHPVAIAPLVRDVPDLRCRAGRMLRAKGVRGGLVERMTVRILVAVLVAVAVTRAFHGAHPASGAIVDAMQGLGVPAVPGADHTDGTRVRRPYGEVRAARDRVRAHDFELAMVVMMSTAPVRRTVVAYPCGGCVSVHAPRPRAMHSGSRSCAGLKEAVAR